MPGAVRCQLQRPSSARLTRTPCPDPNQPPPPDPCAPQAGDVASYDGEALRPRNLSWFERRFVHAWRHTGSTFPATELGTYTHVPADRSAAGASGDHEYVGVGTV